MSEISSNLESISFIANSSMYLASVLMTFSINLCTCMMLQASTPSSMLSVRTRATGVWSLLINAGRTVVDGSGKPKDEVSVGFRCGIERY